MFLGNLSVFRDLDHLVLLVFWLQTGSSFCTTLFFYLNDFVLTCCSKHARPAGGSVTDNETHACTPFLPPGGVSRQTWLTHKCLEGRSSWVASLHKIKRYFLKMGTDKHWQEVSSTKRGEGGHWQTWLGWGHKGDKETRHWESVLQKCETDECFCVCVVQKLWRSSWRTTEAHHKQLTLFWETRPKRSRGWTSSQSKSNYISKDVREHRHERKHMAGDTGIKVCSQIIKAAHFF